MAMFGLMAVLPGVLVYAVSVQFVTKSIETWFDVRVEKALESGLNLGRSALDSLLDDLADKGQSMSMDLSELGDAKRRTALSRLRDQTGVQYVALFSTNGQLLATATSELDAFVPEQPTTDQLRQARVGRGYRGIESISDKTLLLRVLVPVAPSGLGKETRILQLTQPVPEGLALNAERVQQVYRDYQELSLGRQGLTRIYAMTLTLTVLLALFTAIATAYVLARRLSAPLSILAEGTQAVAAGDFTPRQAIYSGDELGVLTQSFNRMTRQLDDARRDTERHRAEVESARAYLESILANLSAGVLVFDRRFVLRTVNAGAQDDSRRRLHRTARRNGRCLAARSGSWTRHPQRLCRARQQGMENADPARRTGRAAEDPAPARHAVARGLEWRLRGRLRRRPPASSPRSAARRGAKWPGVWRTRSRIH